LVIDRIHVLKDECQCPRTFAEFSLNAEDMEKMVMAIMADPMYMMYPIPQEKVVNIVKKVI